MMDLMQSYCSWPVMMWFLYSSTLWRLSLSWRQGPCWHGPWLGSLLGILLSGLLVYCGSRWRYLSFLHLGLAPFWLPLSIFFLAAGGSWALVSSSMVWGGRTAICCRVIIQVYNCWTVQVSCFTCFCSWAGCRAAPDQDLSGNSQHSSWHTQAFFSGWYTHPGLC